MTPRSRVGIDVPRSRVDDIDPVLCDYGVRGCSCSQVGSFETSVLFHVS
jgi:hypothetical protein